MKVRSFIVAICVAVGMATAGMGVANAAPDAPAGFPARVTSKWHTSTTPWGFLRLPIGPPCYGLTVMQAGVTDFDGYSFCATKGAWDSVVIGSVWYGYVGK
jgi:hypothetical protein